MARGAADRLQFEMSQQQSKKDTFQLLFHFVASLLFWLALIALHPFPAPN